MYHYGIRGQSYEHYKHYGIRGQNYNWFANYLAERFQRTKYRGELSSNLPLHHGVHQGSILGPLLFVLYINDLPQCLSKSQISMYGDDTVFTFLTQNLVTLK